MDISFLNKIVSVAIFIFSVSIIVFLIFLILKNKISKKLLLALSALAFSFSIFFSFLKSFLQYLTWRGDGFAKYFLPPYNDTSYFFQYSFFKFFVPSLTAILFSAVIFLAIFFIEKAYKKKALFSEYDKYIFFIGGVLVDWPYFLFYIGAVFLFAFLYLVIASIENLNFKKNVKLTYFWPIAALAVLLLGGYFADFFNLNLLVI